MRAFLYIAVFVFFVIGCEGAKKPVADSGSSDEKEYSDTVRIANDSIEYEVIIIEPGFNSWLASQPPKGHYGLGYLERRNRLYVNEYNRRVFDSSFPRDLYVQEINYELDVSYGLEVNYLLYNYFKYFEQTYKQKLR